MPIFGTPTRYGSVAQAFHWLTVILVGAAYLFSVGGQESRVYATDRASSLGLHETLGLLVVAVLVLRLLWRMIDRAPEEPPMPAWMVFASRAVQWLLYGLLIAVPATAILGAWYEGHPVTFLSLGEIGPYVAVSHDFGRSLTDLHRTLGDAIIWLAGFHAAAALYHHFIARDRVLKMMLPSGSGSA
jgi:cytochrome b561